MCLREAFILLTCTALLVFINQPTFLQPISDWLVDINHKSVMYYICTKNKDKSLTKKHLAIKKPGRALISDG